jgi:hypothetical protein
MSKMTAKEAADEALYAYAMERDMGQEAKKYPGSEYGLRCELSAGWWLRRARRLRLLAEGRQISDGNGD